MDLKNNVRVVEEEKFGWTILSTVLDSELAPREEKLATQREPDLLQGCETDERGTAFNTDGDSPSVGDQKPAEENEESDEAEEVTRDEEDDDADDELEDYGFDDGGDDGDEAKVFAFGDPARGFLWGPEPRQEASTTKQTLAEQQAGQKQGLMWRVSLVATLGFFGWAVLSGLGGGGKNIRCLKLHPCSVKEGESVLSTL